MSARFRRVAAGEYVYETADGYPLGRITDTHHTRTVAGSRGRRIRYGRWQLSTGSAGIGYGCDTLAAAKARMLDFYRTS